MAPKDTDFDLVIIGGGIYGIMLALEASLRGLRVAVVEKEEWGSGTTAGWLRILHGGLRYLQSADLPRFYESVRERRWFLQHFPDLTAPLPCVMPLYRRHSYPRFVMRTAIAMNDILSLHRNRGVNASARLPSGDLMARSEVEAELPFVESDGLRGGARWYDAVVLEPQQLLVELLRWAESLGAVTMQQTEAVSLLRDGGVVSGLEVRDSASGDSRELRAGVVINAAGHWAPALAKRFDVHIDDVPRSSWAWNVLFDVPNDAKCAAAVSARRPGSQMFFMLPWRGLTLVGTGHALMPSGSENQPVPGDRVNAFVGQVAEALPALDLNESRIKHVYQGVLPAVNREEMQLTSRPMIVDHAEDGVKGFYTVWGIKYTTARDIASALIRKAFPGQSNVTVTYRRPPQTTE
jgi:glycerol-3-phosphate dehydrogenase